MKQRLHISSIKGESFTGTWYDPKLSTEQMAALGLTELPGEIDIEGDFHVEWYDDVANPYVDAVFIKLADGKFIAVTEFQVDFNDASDQLFESGDQIGWDMDRIASLGDYAYESYKDAQYENN